MRIPSIIHYNEISHLNIECKWRGKLRVLHVDLGCVSLRLYTIGNSPINYSKFGASACISFPQQQVKVVTGSRRIIFLASTSIRVGLHLITAAANCGFKELVVQPIRTLTRSLTRTWTRTRTSHLQPLLPIAIFQIKIQEILDFKHTH